MSAWRRVAGQARTAFLHDELRRDEGALKLLLRGCGLDAALARFKRQERFNKVAGEARMHHLPDIERLGQRSTLVEAEVVSATKPFTLIDDDKLPTQASSTDDLNFCALASGTKEAA